ncbi:hypothetical protein HK096_010600, partial [Nowakowskiella sp. JEL0078]
MDECAGFVAVKTRNVQATKILCEGIQIDSICWCCNEVSVLNLALRNRDFEMLDMLISIGFDDCCNKAINCLSDIQQFKVCVRESTLHCAAKYGNLEFFRKLINVRGVSEYMICKYQGRFPFEVAVTEGREDSIIEEYVQNFIKLMNKKGRTIEGFKRISENTTSNYTRILQKEIHKIMQDKEKRLKLRNSDEYRRKASLRMVRYMNEYYNAEFRYISAITRHGKLVGLNED